MKELKGTGKIKYQNSKHKLEEITSRRAKRVILASGAISNQECKGEHFSMIFFFYLWFS